MRGFLSMAGSGFPRPSPFPTSRPSSPILQPGRLRAGAAWGWEGDVSKVTGSWHPCSPSPGWCPTPLPSREAAFTADGLRTMHGRLAARWLSAAAGEAAGPDCVQREGGCTPLQGMAPGRPQRRLPNVDAETQGDPPRCEANHPALGGAVHFSRLGRWPRRPE